MQYGIYCQAKMIDDEQIPGDGKNTGILNQLRHSKLFF
jgi:hypothetical protein